MTPGLVKVLLVLLVVVLVGGASFAVFAQMPKNQADEKFNPRGREWVPMDVGFAGMKFEVPGQGWRLDYDALSRLIFKDDFGGTLDIYFVSIIALNPDTHRIDNRPQVFHVLRQDPVTMSGWNESALLTVAQGREVGVLVNKHQIFFRRTFKAANGQPQTFTYLVTLTYPSEYEDQYAPKFQHILRSINLYEYN
jgi:hypothetical protein